MRVLKVAFHGKNGADMRATLRTAFFLVSALLLTGVCSSQAQPPFKLVHAFGGPGDGEAPSWAAEAVRRSVKAAVVPCSKLSQIRQADAL